MKEVLRIKAVQQAVGLSRTTLWRLEREGRFPARRKLSVNCVGWMKDEIEDWIRSRTSLSGGGQSSQSIGSSGSRRRTVAGYASTGAPPMASALPTTEQLHRIHNNSATASNPHRAEELRHEDR